VRTSRKPSQIRIIIEQKQPENVECLRYLDRIITDDKRCTTEIKSRIVMTNQLSRRLFTNKLDLNLRKKLVKCYIRYDAENWTLQKINQKCLERFEM
jgi:hypothetical protein